jgi:hypothetical protein
VNRVQPEGLPEGRGDHAEFLDPTVGHLILRGFLGFGPGESESREGQKDDDADSLFQHPNSLPNVNKVSIAL